MIRGWCPTVHAPMPSGDGLLLRVKPFGGVLTAAMLRTLAEAATRFGNGTVELTSRGNLQLRGIRPGPGCAALLVAAGLADPDPGRERRRNVIVVPPADLALVAEIEAILSATDGLAPKFCVAVGAAAADIAVVAGVMHSAAGTAPYTPDGLRQALSLSLRERAWVRVFAPAAAPGPRPSPPPPFHALSRAEPWAAPPCPLPKGEGSLLHLPFGQTNADALVRLANAVASVQTTPWRAFLLPGGSVAVPGFIADPADPRLGIAACVGGPGCSSGSVPARVDAARLAALGLTRLHVSGCAKGCAHPAAEHATLVGRNGRYDLVRHGRASDPPAEVGLTLADAARVLALAPP